MAYTFISRVLDFIFHIFNPRKYLHVRFIFYGIISLTVTHSQAYYVGDSLVQEGVNAFYNYEFEINKDIRSSKGKIS